MSTALEAAEKLRLLLLESRKASQLCEAREHEAIVEREQRSMAKDSRFEDLFRDLRYIDEDIQNIKENQLAAGSNSETVSPEDVERIMRVAKEGHLAQLTHVVALLEECSERHKEQQAELLTARHEARHRRPAT